MSNGMPVPPHPEPPPQPLQLTVRAQQGGLVIGFTTPFMQVQVIVPEETIPAFLNAIKVQQDKIPKVVLG